MGAPPQIFHPHHGRPAPNLPFSGKQKNGYKDRLFLTAPKLTEISASRIHTQQAGGQWFPPRARGPDRTARLSVQCVSSPGGTDTKFAERTITGEQRGAKPAPLRRKLPCSATLPLDWVRVRARLRNSPN
ncbi:MAG: hypothetical protein CMJ62_03680 [Planctomycetaceae bacterium]|nr:hypothetical protein [Planctomycetaceae bacterium]